MGLVDIGRLPMLSRGEQLVRAGLHEAFSSQRGDTRLVQKEYLAPQSRDNTNYLGRMTGTTPILSG